MKWMKVLPAEQEDLIVGIDREERIQPIAWVLGRSIGSTSALPETLVSTNWLLKGSAITP
jgi:hypothetical protein